LLESLKMGTFTAWRRSGAIAPFSGRSFQPTVRHFGGLEKMDLRKDG
jgi:hypothetical protein